MPRLALLMAGLLLLLALEGTCAAPCIIPTGNGTAEAFRPGLFSGGPAPPEGSGNCSGLPSDVPPGSRMPFWFGTATASYQIEGAVKEGGRGASIWDTFAHTPGKVFNNENGDVATDFYHRYLEDIQLMKSLGIRNFRFSLAWPRLLPSGRGEVNQEGVDFYDRLIDALLANCIEPWVTLFHWDLPQPLQDEYGGWLDARIVRDFDAYARLAFSLFGDRVKRWATINEPSTICTVGYEAGVHAPGRCSDRARCTQGNSTTEPQICAYYAMLAHAQVVRSFRELVPDGQISITTNMGYSVPLTDTEEDKAAAERLNEWTGAQYLDPLFRGDWSPLRRAVLPPEILPRFTPEQSELLLEGKPDYIALQYYGGSYALFQAGSHPFEAGTTINGPDGSPLPVADSPWLVVFPRSFREQLRWLAERYPGVPIVVTENGVDVPGEDGIPLEASLCDAYRVDYYRQYLGNASEAVREDGVPLQGYFAWSLLDNFEWADGYSKRFGVVHVDYPTQARYYKASSIFLSQLFGLSDAASSAEEPPPGAVF